MLHFDLVLGVLAQFGLFGFRVELVQLLVVGFNVLLCGAGNWEFPLVGLDLDYLVAIAALAD